MCGICGWIKPGGIELTLISQMNCLASHRGPDGEGYWFWDGKSSSTGQFISSKSVDNIRQKGIIGLGHRRLAILDLSDAGLQPMSSKNKQVWIAYNGEIYNYLELRDELIKEGHKFHTKTDTEVILSAYEQWGTRCFAHFNGMWGLSIIDLKRRVVIFSRDRLGIKPLYIWTGEQELAFASEIKQFFVLPNFTASANMDAVIEYIETGYEVPPATFFEGIYAFPPGCWGEVFIDRPKYPSPETFWSPDSISKTNIDHDEVIEQTRSLFEDSVRLRLRSDVPVGVCLSGGLDSTAIFGQMQLLKEEKTKSIYAFSSKFDDPRFDEGKYIDYVLKFFGDEGYYTVPSAQGFLNELDTFIFHHDEPTGSLSQYAAWCVMRLAQQHHVSVLLNGQGGDELFSGYWSAYYLFLKQQYSHSPWRIAEHLLFALLPGGNSTLLLELIPHLRKYKHRKRRKNCDILLPHWRSSGSALRKNWSIVAQQLKPDQYRIHEIRNIHLPRLLKWEDRNSMAFSIEGRYPFLDYRLVELAITLPPEINLSRGWNKLLLRKSLAHVLPPIIRWRHTKVGFETPQSEWIRTILRPIFLDWANQPSEKLQNIIDRNQLKQLANKILSLKSLHKMDEWQILLVRLFILDRWLDIFNIEIKSNCI